MPSLSTNNINSVVASLRFWPPISEGKKNMDITRRQYDENFILLKIIFWQARACCHVCAPFIILVPLKISCTKVAFKWSRVHRTASIWYQTRHTPPGTEYQMQRLAEWVVQAYTRPIGENGGFSTKDGNTCSTFLCTFCFFSSLTALSKPLMSSWTNTLNMLDCKDSTLFSCPTTIEVSIECKIATQIENACNADNWAWKSTEYCPSSLSVIVNAGALSFLPCIEFSNHEYGKNTFGTKHYQ